MCLESKSRFHRWRLHWMPPVHLTRYSINKNYVKCPIKYILTAYSMALRDLSTRRAGQQATRPLFGPSVRPAAAQAQRSQSRRELLQLGIVLPFVVSGPAIADEALTLAVSPPPAPELSAVAPAPSASQAPAPAGRKDSEQFLDLDFQLVPPPDFTFVDTQPVYDPNRRGPAPEPSPVRARFDSPDGACVVSVLVRNAQAIRPSILQVSDVTGFGGLEEAAKLLLPRGSRVIAASTLQVVVPPKQTALGPVELPSRSYYRYEFTTPNGLHVVMSAAAMKGRVYVCGGSTSAAGWERYGSVLRAATETFRLRADSMVL